MNRQEFMAQLQRLLWDIPESDRLDAIAYYNDYFDEAGVENEAKVIQKLGSPGKVAAIIKADLNGTGNERAEYTENGYSENSYSYEGYQNENSLSRRETGYREPKPKRSVPLVFLIILIIFASPLLLGVGGGILGGVVGVLGAIIGIAIAVVIGCVALLVGGIAGILFGIIKVLFAPIYGLLYIGIGALSLAVGILLTILILWCVLKWIPALFRVTVNFIQRLLHKNERGNQA